MQLTLRERLSQFTHLTQTTLFERLSEEVGPLTESARLLVSVVGMLALNRHIPAGRGPLGRPLQDRLALATAFIARAIYKIETTRKLIERLHTDRQLRCLCGWNSPRRIPHESTFSRAFAEFAQSELPQRLHEAVIRDTVGTRLTGHITRDSTAIEAREHFPEKSQDKAKEKLPRRKRGRPKKGDRSLPTKRLARQRRQSLAEMLKELPRQCSLGVKKAADGNRRFWRGYKLHIDVADGQIPISCLLTSASVHDSQVAIPLATMSAGRVVSLYDVMDSAYEAHEIYAHSRQLGHVPLIARNTGTVPIPHKSEQNTLRGGDRRRKLVTRRERKRPPFDPAEARRYNIRTMSERVNARLKDEFGAHRIWVRGPQKVMAHLMFGVLALTVDQLLRLVS
jgi:Transposase DDE domain/Transposase domain (DUF772)